MISKKSELIVTKQYLLYSLEVLQMLRLIYWYISEVCGGVFNGLKVCVFPMYSGFLPLLLLETKNVGFCCYFWGVISGHPRVIKVLYLFIRDFVRGCVIRALVKVSILERGKFKLFSSFSVFPAKRIWTWISFVLRLALNVILENSQRHQSSEWRAKFHRTIQIWKHGGFGKKLSGNDWRH